ncbi:hypothetical protein ACH475_33635 [Streptomyces globisporus]|uniref:hypothetical protein n=1 Tax=Streptomyces globisporus TaxID=1908 RepID=UPI0036989D2E
MPQLAQLKQVFELASQDHSASGQPPERRLFLDKVSRGAGRGLLLVEALSVPWGTEHGPFPRKTVRAEVALTGS